MLTFRMNFNRSFWYSRFVLCFSQRDRDRARKKRRSICEWNILRYVAQFFFSLGCSSWPIFPFAVLLVGVVIHNFITFTQPCYKYITKCYYSCVLYGKREREREWKKVSANVCVTAIQICWIESKRRIKIPCLNSIWSKFRRFQMVRTHVIARHSK